MTRTREENARDLQYEEEHKFDADKIARARQRFAEARSQNQAPAPKDEAVDNK